jgi:hypothetical protein
VASVGHRPRGLFAFEYCLPNGLFETDYWSHYLPALEKALFVREIQYFEWLFRMRPSLRGFTAQSKDRQAFSRAFTQMLRSHAAALSARGDSICTMGCAIKAGHHGGGQIGIAHVTTSHQRSTGTARYRRHLGCQRVFSKLEPLVGLCPDCLRTQPSGQHLQG